jgi:hypothetical protein
MALARAYEQRLAMPEDMASHTLARPAYSRPATKMLPLPAPPPAKMPVKRKKGECYNCTEQFSREHLKVCPMKGVFLLEMVLG